MTSGGNTETRKGPVSAGAALLWRRQEILWWVFAANLVLGGVGTLGVAKSLNSTLGFNLAGDQLVKGFDLGMFYELLRLPDGDVLRSRFTAYACAVLFALFILVIGGGILESFRQDRRLSTGDFFAASGAFFWRLARLTAFSLVPFAVFRFAYDDVRTWSEYLGDKVVADEVEFIILAVGVLILALMGLIVRVWFDLAKVRTVAQDDSGMWQGMWKALDMTFRHLGTLLWLYLRIILAAAIVLLIGFLIWTKLPPTATPATFVLLELMILSQLAARLWQLASTTAWYKGHAELIAADAVTEAEQIIEPAPSSEPESFPDADLEMPLGNA